MLDIETVQLVTTKLEISNTKITQTNSMEFLQLDLDRTFYENLCECVCAYRYSRVIQSVVLITFIIDNRVILIISFLILN